MMVTIYYNKRERYTNYFVKIMNLFSTIFLTYKLYIKKKKNNWIYIKENVFKTTGGIFLLDHINYNVVLFYTFCMCV